MSQMKIYGFAGSTYVRTTRMVCLEKGAPYRLLPLEFGYDSHRDLHPFLRMPILDTGKHRLYETLAIVSYIDRTSQGPSLQPDDSFAHAEMLQWISVCNDYLYNGVVRTMVKSGTRSVDELNEALDALWVLDRALCGRTFLAGEKLTLADLFLAPMVVYMMDSHSDIASLDGFDSLPHWIGRMAARPSFAETAG